MELHNNIQDVQKSMKNSMDLALLAEQILHELNGFNPGNMWKHSAWNVIGIMFATISFLYHYNRLWYPENKDLGTPSKCSPLAFKK